MALERFIITAAEPYQDGKTFGSVGPYQRIEATAHYAVDPQHQANSAIADLNLASRDSDGLVRFRGDVSILAPLSPERTNRALLVQVPNRGRYITTHINHYPHPPPVLRTIAPGDGFLMCAGWTVAWVGWQWDVPRNADRTRIGLVPPCVPTGRRGNEPLMQLRLLIDADADHVALTDQHVGSIGGHQTIEPLDTDDRRARLLVRDSIYGKATDIDFDDWGFGRQEGGGVVANPNYVWCRHGFRAGRIYDVLYQPRHCPVVGAGLLAIRDCADWLRRDPLSPVGDCVDIAIGEGVSQCGRLLRHFLKLGLNQAEGGQAVFDGVLCHIAGGRTGEFNHRHAQPSVQPTPSVGHRFPFADEPQSDPLSGSHAGLLDRQRQLGCLPKIIYTDSAAEYWRGDAALTHTNLANGGDIELPPMVRRYLFAGAPHSPGLASIDKVNMYGGKAANWLNMLDCRPLYRACLENLRLWIAQDLAPPASRFPRHADGTRMNRRRVLAALAQIPAMQLPAADTLTSMRALDLGPMADGGQPELPARFGDAVYPDWVSAIDADGNETGGIAMPDQAVPVATHTGFNPRHPDTGGDHLMLEYFGSSLPFAATQEQRRANGDPRPALDERYRSLDHYLELVTQAAQDLVAQRYLLTDDIALCVQIARARYQAVVDAQNGD